MHLASGRMAEAGINGALACFLITAPFLMRRHGRYPLVVNGALAASVLTMSFVAIRDRGPGLNSSTLVVALIPLLATLLVGIRAGAAWTAISCVLSVSIGRWARMRPTNLGTSGRLNDQLVLVLVTVVLYLVAVFYERGRARQLVQIAELEARRHAVDLERLRTISEARVAQGEHLASLTRIAEAVAHEMNNPLAYVLTNLEFLKTRLQEPEELRDAVADGIDGARRLERIVAQLFQFMRPAQTGPTHGNVGEAIRAAVEIAAGRLHGKAAVHTDLGDVPLVQGSTPQITHVFLNLLVNAAQNIPDGNVAGNRVGIRAILARGRVCIEVEDTGERHAAAVVQGASAVVSADPPGYAPDLGLALAHTILETVGGKLEFESRPGRTIARVWLEAAAEGPATGSGRAET